MSNVLVANAIISAWKDRQYGIFGTVGLINGEPWKYPMVPALTGQVPTALMPVLPSRLSMTQAWVNNPLLLQPPAHPAGWPAAEVEGYYCINKYHPNATDANIYGHPDAPRLTIPEFGSNTIYAEIHGNNLEHADGVDYNITDNYVSDGVTGTDANPVFIVGINRPRYQGIMAFQNFSHIIVDGVWAGWDGVNDRGGRVRPGNNVGGHHFTWRNGGLIGRDVNPLGSRGGVAFSIGGSESQWAEFVCFDNNEVGYQGVWNGDGKDYHGFRPLWHARYCWCTRNYFHHIGGDAIQCGNSGNNDKGSDEVSHYIYFAGNEGAYIRENIADQKNSYHVFIVDNYSHDMLHFSKASDKTHLILANDSEGPYSGYQFAINNILDCGGTENGIRNSGNANNDGLHQNRTFMFGNIVIDADDFAYNLSNNSNSTVGSYCDAYFNLALRCNGAGFRRNYFQEGGKELTRFRMGGNITIDCAEHVYSQVPAGTLEIYDHIAWNTDLSTPSMVSADADIIDNYLVVDPDLDSNHNPNAGSPCINAAREPDVIQEAFELYGLDGLRRDFADRFRPGGTRWNIGPSELRAA